MARRWRSRWKRCSGWSEDGDGGMVSSARYSRGLNQQDGAGILRERAVRSEQSYAFLLCLGDQNSVERVLVDWRKPCNGNRVIAGDSELDKTIVQQFIPKLLRIKQKICPSSRRFYRDFPDAGRTEVRWFPRFSSRPRAISDSTSGDSDAQISRWVSSKNLMIHRKTCPRFLFDTMCRNRPALLCGRA